MKLTSKFLILILCTVLSSCSPESTEHEGSIVSVDVTYKVKNNIPNETISIVSVEYDVNGEPIVEILETLETGETSKKLSTVGLKDRSDSKNIIISCSFSFITPLEEGFRSESFFSSKESGIMVLLSRRGEHSYRAEVIKE